MRQKLHVRYPRKRIPKTKYTRSLKQIPRRKKNERLFIKGCDTTRKVEQKQIAEYQQTLEQILRAKIAEETEFNFKIIHVHHDAIIHWLKLQIQNSSQTPTQSVKKRA